MDYWEKEIDKIGKWLVEYMDNSKCDGFVIGISGGIDSAVCLSILKRKIHSSKIIAVALPCNSNENSLIDAQKLVDNLNIRLETIDLQNSFNSIVENLETINHKNEEISSLVKGNIAARLRMVQLYSIANQHNYLVLGTSNKSEIMCGYGTKFGDLGIDLDPLGNYYKTQVYNMAKLMPEIPDQILIKAPSADLWGGQTDEEDLGMTYKKLDRILRLMEPYYSWNKVYIDTDKITEEEFMKVRGMIMKADHKNNIPPTYERK